MDFSRFDTTKLYDEFIVSTPYNHLVIDNFLSQEYIMSIYNEVKEYDNGII